MSLVRKEALDLTTDEHLYNALLLVWEASDPEEWIDKLTYLP